jgi:hypothetical protein
LAHEHHASRARCGPAIRHHFCRRMADKHLAYGCRQLSPLPALVRARAHHRVGFRQRRFWTGWHALGGPGRRCVSSSRVRFTSGAVSGTFAARRPSMGWSALVPLTEPHPRPVTIVWHIRRCELLRRLDADRMGPKKIDVARGTKGNWTTFADHSGGLFLSTLGPGQRALRAPHGSRNFTTPYASTAEVQIERRLSRARVPARQGQRLPLCAISTRSLRPI